LGIDAGRGWAAYAMDRLNENTKTSHLRKPFYLGSPVRITVGKSGFLQSLKSALVVQFWI
jgi:hypothetical protein